MKNEIIKGNVVFVNLETGFWGIEAENGKKYRPIEMPQELQEDGLEIAFTYKSAESGISMFMWGIPIELLTYTSDF